MTTKIDFIDWLSNPNTIIAITAILISIIGLVFSVLYNRKTIRISIMHNELSVKPLLHFSNRIDNNEGMIKYELSNQGLGPAIIKYLRYKYEDDYYDNINDFFTALDKRLITNQKVKFHLDYNELSENAVLSPNNSIKLFSIIAEPKIYTDSLSDLLDKIDIEIFYNDMYDNKFSNN